MLKSQNTKLRDAIILMRDLSENQKVENEKNVKEVFVNAPSALRA